LVNFYQTTRRNIPEDFILIQNFAQETLQKAMALENRHAWENIIKVAPKEKGVKVWIGYGIV
jgi:hypothetical protein